MYSAALGAVRHEKAVYSVALGAVRHEKVVYSAAGLWYQQCKWP